MAKIIGEYLLDKSNLQSLSDPDLTLQVATRPHPTPYKPSNYLLRASPTGQHQYLSSLFPLNVGPYMGREAYSLDYAGEYLTMVVDRTAGIVEIRRRDPGEYALIPGPKPGQTGGKTGSKQVKTTAYHRENNEKTA
jgi:hypothetical protein